MTAQRRHEIKWGLIFSALGALGGLGGAIIGGMLSVGGFVQDIKNDHITLGRVTDTTIAIRRDLNNVQQDALKFSLPKTLR